MLGFPQPKTFLKVFAMSYWPAGLHLIAAFLWMPSANTSFAEMALPAKIVSAATLPVLLYCLHKFNKERKKHRKTPEERVLEENA
jgi:hypothetical protein